MPSPHDLWQKSADLVADRLVVDDARPFVALPTTRGGVRTVMAYVLRSEHLKQIVCDFYGVVEIHVWRKDATGEITPQVITIEPDFSSQRRLIMGVFKPMPRASFGSFLKAVARGDQKTLEEKYGSRWSDHKAANIVKSPMGEESGVIGGYTVPPQFSRKMMDDIAEDGFIMPRADVTPMTTLQATFPKIDVESTYTPGTSPLFGGLKFQWAQNNGLAVPETEPKFRQMTLHAWDLLGYCTVSNQFLEDIGPEGDAKLMALFAKATSWQAEYAFLQGAGAGGFMPLGILNAPATVKTTRTTSTQIKTSDIASMAGSLLPYSWRNAIWACSPTCLPQITALTTFYLNDGVGDTGDPGAYCGRLLTRPLFVTDKLPALGSTGDLVLFDPSLYAIGTRDFIVDRSTLGPKTLTTNQTDLRVWLRIDGRPMVQSPVTLADGATQVSPYVALHS